MTTQPYTQNATIFDQTSDYGQTTLLPTQTNVSSPTPDTLGQVTSPLVPPTGIDALLTHFPDAIYDLRPETHLRKFLNVLLGDSGAGQLRKRYTITRLQQSFDTTHFFDLDAFYGAIFGAQRHVDESVPVDPMSVVATPDEWDEVAVSDAKYRERLKLLARGIGLGATVAGVRALAEAVFAAPCEVYEVWSLMDEAQQAAAANNTWDDITSEYLTWSEIEGVSWSELTGEQVFGGSAANNRSEFIVQPKKTWESDRLQAAEVYDARRCINKIKPAGTLLTVAAEGVALHQPAEIAALTASSEYWEVQAIVSPKQAVTIHGVPLYPAGINPIDVGLQEQPMARPPFSAHDGWEVFYNADVVSVAAYSEDDAGTTTTDQANYEVVTYADGQTITYSGDQALLSSRDVLAGQYTQDGVLVAHPYSGARPTAVLR